LEKRLSKAEVAPGSFRVQFQPLSNTAELASEGFQLFFFESNRSLQQGRPP